MVFDIHNLVRKNIIALRPYSSAREEFTGMAEVLLDANENPFGTLNRYPDPYQKELKSALSLSKKVSPDSIFIGNGSDEVIDLLFRIFCNPGVDKALTFTPTYGMYEVMASINDIGMIQIPLDENFDIDFSLVESYLLDPTLKLICICTPNNPTGNVLNAQIIEKILQSFKGIILIDEAYIDFCEMPSFIEKLEFYPNLIISQTMSKARGLAAARVGIAYASTQIIDLMNKVKPPYNISSLNQNAAINAMKDDATFLKNKEDILSERIRMTTALYGSPLVIKIFPSHANFLLVEVENANLIYSQLVESKVIVRNRHNVVKNCIRITIGSPSENQKLLSELNKIKI